MSKILANQIANYLDNAPIEIKEGLNIPSGKPLQVDGTPGTSGQVLTSNGTGLDWVTPPYFSGAYADLTGLPTIPAAQINSDWNSTTGVARILNKPSIPPLSSVVVGPAQGGGDLTFNSANGQFTFTPPDLSSFSTFSGVYSDLSGKPDLSVYLTSYTETDPVFTASPAGSITNTNKTNWNTAYGWGDHGAAGYLTSEADTLDSVTGRGNTTTNDVTVNDMTVNGDLTVIGTTTQNNQSTLNVAATEIVINDGQSGAPALDGHIKIDRGTGTDVSLKWNEGSDRWQFTNDGTTYYNLPTGTNDLTNNAGFLTSYTETDPVFSASAASGIGSSDITNWNTAYGWGNHATAGYLTSESDTLDDVVGRGDTTNLAATFGDLTCTNLTVTGTTTQINTTQLTVSDNLVVLNNDVTTTPTENAGVEVERGLSANTRLLWNEGSDRWTFTNDGSTYFVMPTSIGDLSNDVGYITGYTETDPVFSASVASGIGTGELANWNAAYNWGDHAQAGYLTSVGSIGDATDVAISSIADGQLLKFQTSTQEWVNWTPNYLTSYTETDPVFSASDAANVTNAKIANWDAAYGWGDHGSQGYLTAEADTLDTVLGRGATTTRDITTTGKIYYSNNFATTGDLPNASTYHGMFAHVHAEGHGYFAHAGAWTQLLDTGSNLSELADVTTTAPNTNDVLTWDGSNWGPAAPTGGGGGGGATVTTSDTAPSTPSDGDLWWKSDEGRLKVYYDDGVGTPSAQWVDASPPLTSNLLQNGGSSVAAIDTSTSGNNALEFSTNNGTAIDVRWRITAQGSLIPAANDTYDIGSAEFKVRDLYVNDGSIHTESGNALSFYNGNLTWGGDDVIMLQDLKDMMMGATSFEDFKNAIMGL